MFQPNDTMTDTHTQRQTFILQISIEGEWILLFFVIKPLNVKIEHLKLLFQIIKLMMQLCSRQLLHKL